MHAGDRLGTHVTGNDNDAGIQQVNQFTILLTVEVAAECHELVIREDAAFGYIRQQRAYLAAGLIVIEPEARHGGVVGDDEITALVQAQCVYLAADVHRAVDRRHAVVGADKQTYIAVVLARQRHQFAQAFLVPFKLGVHLLAGLADLVQQAVHRGHVEKGKGNLALAEAALQ